MKGSSAAQLLNGALIAVGPVHATDDGIADVTDLRALRSAVKADRRALVASTLKLTDGQAKRFWPIYDAYQRSLDAANRRRVMAVEALIIRDKPVTDLYARKLANELLAADEAELKARRKMQRGVMKALPPLKAARYLQLESKIRAVQAYDIAATIPLIR
jgi:Spy/CpxP family protein refolding chaperone